MLNREIERTEGGLMRKEQRESGREREVERDHGTERETVWERLSNNERERKDR